MDLFYSLDPKYDEDIKIEHVIKDNIIIFTLTHYHMTYIYTYPKSQLLELSAMGIDLETMLLNKILQQVPQKYHNDIIAKILR